MKDYAEEKSMRYLNFLGIRKQPVVCFVPALISPNKCQNKETAP